MAPSSLSRCFSRRRLSFERRSWYLKWAAGVELEKEPTSGCLSGCRLTLTLLFVMCRVHNGKKGILLLLRRYGLV